MALAAADDFCTLRHGIGQQFLDLGQAGPVDQRTLRHALLRSTAYLESGLAKVEELLADAVAQGAKVVCGGKRHARGGTFFEPTVLTGATPAMRLAREEIFGPVAPIFGFKDEAEAVRLANDTEFGLAASFYSRNIARAWRVGEALDYGMVGINAGVISNEVAPFGGVKQSGLGREGSRHGIEEYLEIKYLAMAGL
jgi:succinate-semialdehyde dehydrogenase/glutarate-semialdehyde dehydrogenase